MEEQKSQGLKRAAEINGHRDYRARQLKEEGKKIFGYFCCYPPIELLTSLDITGVRVLGDMDEPVTEADDFLPSVMCMFCRSAFDLGMKAKYDYFDGFVGSHARRSGPPSSGGISSNHRVISTWTFRTRPMALQ